MSDEFIPRLRFKFSTNAARVQLTIIRDTFEFKSFRAFQDTVIYTVYYFLNSDFRFTFPIKSKFIFIDFALHLLKKKNKLSNALHFVLPSNPGFNFLLEFKKCISYKKAVRQVSPVGLIRS